MPSAEYMRDYRKRRKEAVDVIVAVAEDDATEVLALRAENARLVEEVARLKRELAQRTDTTPLTKLATIYDDGQGGQLRKREPGVLSTDPRIGPERNPSHEFNPAPKPGKRK